MKVLISTILILIISLTGTVFGIQDPADPIIPTSVIDETLEGTSDAPKEIDPISTEKPKETETLEKLPIEEVETLPVDLITDKFNETMETAAEEAKANISLKDMSFSSPVFKIIVLATGVIIVILLLLAASKGKDTSYKPTKESKVPKAPKEVAPPIEVTEEIIEEEIPITPLVEKEVVNELGKEEEILIEGMDEPAENMNLNLDDDFLLDLDNVQDSASDLGLADELTEDVEIILDDNVKQTEDVVDIKEETIDELENIKDDSLVLDFDEFDDFDDIDDIDELSKVIQEKEEELKRLEEEVEQEKQKEQEKASKKEKETKDKKVKKEKKDKKESKKAKKEEKVIKEVEEIIEEVPEVPEKVEEVVEELDKENEIMSGSAEDFLKNMEKNMKEDKKK